MPQNTPRGYPYPCYQDDADFPTALEDLAEAVDTDTNDLNNAQYGARNLAPSCRVSATSSITMPAGTAVNLTWTTEEYDNASMFPGSGSDITIALEGVYLVSCNFNTPSGTTGLRNLYIAGSVGIRGVQTRQQSITAAAVTNAQMLMFIPAGGFIRISVESNVATTATARTLSVTRLTGTTPVPYP